MPSYPVVWGLMCELKGFGSALQYGVGLVQVETSSASVETCKGLASAIKPKDEANASSWLQSRQLACHWIPFQVNNNGVEL